MDPITLLVLKTWLQVRPIHKWKEHRAAKKDTTPEALLEGNVMTAEMISLIIRHGLTIAGGAGMFSDTEMGQIAGAISTLGGLAWSAYRKIKRG